MTTARRKGTSTESKPDACILREMNGMEGGRDRGGGSMSEARIESSVGGLRHEPVPRAESRRCLDGPPGHTGLMRDRNQLEAE